MADVDIKENDILRLDRRILSLLLKDNSSKKNIIWATDNYASMGAGFEPTSEIAIESITGNNGLIIRPRIAKSKEEQIYRVRDKAEVFTPAWMCNCQNNLIDSAWFGEDGIFNIELGDHWRTETRTIPFPTKDGETWMDYVEDVRLEVTCGEAPYITSRYDVITGDSIAVWNRIGLLDRKLRVVAENTHSQKDWFRWAKKAVQSIYGYEWQGDNLLLARENILFTYIEHFDYLYHGNPPLAEVESIAKVISWNVWQMDGLRGVVPYSCQNIKITTYELWGAKEEIHPCEGCLTDNIKRHNGIYCRIKDWNTGGTIRFISMIK